MIKLEKYTYGDGIITFYDNGTPYKNVFYNTLKELKSIISNEEVKKEW